MKIAISLTISAPGAGKGTQAELLAKHFDLIHFDTGKYLEKLLHSPRAEKDPILKREQTYFETGILTTPSWILGQAKEQVEKIAKQNKGLVLSGSPRTLYETFGDEKETGLTETLADLYGKENVYFIKLDIDEETTLKRNSKRVVCSIDGFPIFSKEDEEKCEKLGGKPRKRGALDTPKVIKERIREYKERTFPMIKQLKEEGYNVLEVDGSPKPPEVFQLILKALKING
jgi:adenylate kinase